MTFPPVFLPASSSGDEVACGISSSPSRARVRGFPRETPRFSRVLPSEVLPCGALPPWILPPLVFLPWAKPSSVGPSFAAPSSAPLSFDRLSRVLFASAHPQPRARVFQLPRLPVPTVRPAPLSPPKSCGRDRSAPALPASPASSFRSSIRPRPCRDFLRYGSTCRSRSPGG